MKLLLKRIYNRIKRLMKFDADTTKLVDDTKYQSLISVIKTNYNKATTLVPLHELSGKDKTIGKQRSRMVLIEHIVSAVDLLKSYGFVNQFDKFLTIEHCTKSALDYCSSVDLLIRSQSLLELIALNPTESENAGVTAEMITGLTGASTDYGNHINMPKAYRKQHHDITLEVESLLNNINALVDSGLVPYMRSIYKKSDPELYQAFTNALETDAIPSHKRAIKGVITDADTKKPLQKVKLYIDDEKALLRGGETGLYFVQNLPAGEHLLRFELKAHHPFVKRIMLMPNITYVLNVELIPLEVEQLAIAE